MRQHSIVFVCIDSNLYIAHFYEYAKGNVCWVDLDEVVLVLMDRILIMLTGVY